MPTKQTHEQRLEWEEKINKQRSSGLSIEKWCFENQVRSHRFYYWRDQLFPKTINRSSFVELNDSKGNGICIEYRGINIHINRNFDSLTLKRCLSVLKEIKC